ncbi:NAD dependent epimerase/dehydratase family protein [Stieleria maiorica]|uniref:NAD dependent epimerase/dehydratase family protein n=1 Tax=Stieleria maiorica TaxID=2795974 RepID=A0A5B9MKE7_9BACT|nr:NAD-dependent epimerase/dehydratase family protein [Stieleria maiorica]QEG01699.1 NAD dependent epimerase/dehydratase family protein [Stieleria maiorica]
MRVFVTGGTGLLGNTVIRTLRERGHEVSAFVRSEPEADVFAGLDVTLVHGRLVPDADGPDADGPDADGPDAGRSNDAPAPDDPVDRAIAQSDGVVHAAAMIHLGWKKIDESMWVNCESTRRIIQSCIRHAKKLAYVGTVNAIALGSPQTIADETTPLDHAGGQVQCAYVRSKRASLELVRRCIADGLQTVILHPGFMLGPWDWKPSSGRMMLEVGTGWKPIAPSGGCSLCDSRDVAAGVIAALQSDSPNGREFILAGHNWTYKKLWTEMAKRMGTRPPIRAAGPGMEYLAGLAGDFWGRVTGVEPDVNSAGVAMSSQYHWYSSRRAEAELGYQIRDADETLDTAAEWIRDRFVLPGKVETS